MAAAGGAIGAAMDGGESGDRRSETGIRVDFWV